MTEPAVRQFLWTRWQSAHQNNGDPGCGCHSVTFRGNGPGEIWCGAHEQALLRVQAEAGTGQ